MSLPPFVSLFLKMSFLFKGSRQPSFRLRWMCVSVCVYMSDILQLRLKTGTVEMQMRMLKGVFSSPNYTFTPKIPLSCGAVDMVWYASYFDDGPTHISPLRLSPSPLHTVTPAPLSSPGTLSREARTAPNLLTA